MDQPVVVGIENVAYQDALKQTFDEKGRETGRFIPVIGVTNITDKFLRISTMGPLVENGTIRFCLDGTQAKLVSQLLYLGKTKDDLADALQGAVALARKHNFKPAYASSTVQVGGREASRSPMRDLTSKQIKSLDPQRHKRFGMLVEVSRRNSWH